MPTPSPRTNGLPIETICTIAALRKLAYNTLPLPPNGQSKPWINIDLSNQGLGRNGGVGINNLPHTIIPFLRSINLAYNIRKLDLSNNHLTESDFVFLMQTLPGSIHTLDLSNNGIGAINFFKLLNNPNKIDIENLNLSNNLLGESFINELFPAIFQFAKHDLNLSDNSLGLSSFKALPAESILLNSHARTRKKFPKNLNLENTLINAKILREIFSSNILIEKNSTIALSRNPYLSLKTLYCLDKALENLDIIYDHHTTLGYSKEIVSLTKKLKKYREASQVIQKKTNSLPPDILTVISSYLRPSTRRPS